MDLNRIKEDVLSALKLAGVTSMAVYGSRVAGYAKEDSDYDIMVLVEGYEDKLRYYYFSGSGGMYSALVVDRGEAERDATSSKMGEFFAGRLLNPYIPIVGEEELKRLEVIYKRRVIEEELSYLYADYGEFVYELQIPYKYFLYSKLRRRYLIYPPALYSYAMTYAPEREERNLAMTLPGFAEAAKGIPGVLPGGEGVSVERGYRFVERPLGEELDTLKRAILQYVYHSRSGKVKPDVVLWEAVSKIRRGTSTKVTNVYLKKPWLLLRLRGAELWEGEEAKSLVKDGRAYLYNGRRVVLKRFSGRKQLKWYLLGVVGKPIKPFETSPLKRLYNEYRGLLWLRGRSIRAPEPVAVSVKGRFIVKEYVDGPNLLSVIKKGGDAAAERAREFGRYLRSIHDGGAAVGDPKPENAIVSGSGVVLVDLEQFSEGATSEDMGWDIAEFLYYTVSMILNRSHARAVVNAFLEGYGQNPEVIRQALSVKLMLPFLAIGRADGLMLIRRMMAEAIGEELKD